MLDLDKFLKEKTLSEKLIWLIGAILFFLLGCLTRSSSFPKAIEVIIGIIPPKHLVAVFLFIVLILVLIIVLFVSSLNKLKAKYKDKFLRKTFAPLNNIDVTFIYKNPFYFPCLTAIEIVSEAKSKFVCDICGYEITDPNGDGTWECHCENTSYSSNDIVESFEAARRNLLFTIDKPISK